MNRRPYPTWLFLIAVVSVWIACSAPPEPVAETRSDISAPTPTDAPWVPSQGSWTCPAGLGAGACWWMPDPNWGVPGWSDSIGPRVVPCSGSGANGDLDIFSGSFAGRCARIHGVQADANPTGNGPAGIYFHQSYLADSGWLNGMDGEAYTGSGYPIVNIVTWRLWGNAHAEFCDQDMVGGASQADVCGPNTTPGSGSAHHQYVVNDRANYSIGGWPPGGWTIRALAVGINAAPPPPCPYLSGGPQPLACLVCTSYDASGYPIVVCGDGLTRPGNYATIGNPIAGPPPASPRCLGQDIHRFIPVVYAYPVGTTTAPGCP